MDEPFHESRGVSALLRLKEGVRILMHHPLLRGSVGCASTVNFFTFMIAAVYVLYASRTLGLSAGVIGITLGVGAVGALVGALVAPRIGRRLGLGPTIVLGCLLFSVPLVAAAVRDRIDVREGGDPLLRRVRLRLRRDALRHELEQHDGARGAAATARADRGRVARLQLRHAPVRRAHRRSARRRDRNPADAALRGDRRGARRSSGCSRRRSPGRARCSEALDL